MEKIKGNWNKRCGFESFRAISSLLQGTDLVTAMGDTAPVMQWWAVLGFIHPTGVSLPVGRVLAMTV